MAGQMTGTGPGNITWQVTGQAPATKPGSAGRFEDGMTVRFTTGTGTMATVFVPDNAYNATNVRALIARKVAKIAAVSTLTEQS